MRRPKDLTGPEVMARMQAGDLPHLSGGYTLVSYFSDGARVSHFTMRTLRMARKVAYPEGTNCDAPWTLLPAQD